MTLSTSFLIAAAAALGLDTAEWINPNPEVVAQVEAMESAMAAMAKGETPAVPLQDSISRIRQLADTTNDRDAQFSVGVLLQQSTQPNALAEAQAYYKKAADQGQLLAMNNYGFLLAGSGQDATKMQEGVEYIRKAAEGGLNPARRNLAAFHLQGLAGLTRDPDAALPFLEKAALEGDHQAQFELAQFYLETGGEERVDDDKAWEWLNKAADGGNPNALATLGSLLFDGKTFGARKIDPDPAGAVATFSRLADQGVPAGLRTMGEIYASGLANMPRDFKKALDYLTRAAEGNDTTAQILLGGYYDKGVDLDPDDNVVEVSPNPTAALQLYRLAANAQVPLALYNVGIFYENGRTVDKDPQKAFSYFVDAAGRGFLPAMQKAGFYYMSGIGTPKDHVAASGWFSRTANAGVPEGLLNLGVMAESGLVSVSAESTPAKAAYEAYLQVIRVPELSESTRFQALIRLGGLHFRGVLVEAGEAPRPDYPSAYLYFKQAASIAPGDEIAQRTVQEVSSRLSPEIIAKLDAAIGKEMPESRPSLSKTTAATTAVPAGGSSPVPAVGSSLSTPAPSETLTPAPSAGTQPTPSVSPDNPRFRLPPFGR